LCRYYDADSHLQIAHTAESAKGVPFSKSIARQDQVGSHGERSAAAMAELARLDDDHAELYMSDQLDIDYGRAKDAATGRSLGQFKLYIKVGGCRYNLGLPSTALMYTCGSDLCRIVIRRRRKSPL